ncbi:acyl-CoA carboxylase subunit beta [Noviherbaspirillum sp. Root189]|uniref:acyl-CoA carboxylase subunit beta n=1 Tax=Noviherbaspirillum sp. Root189 TaxID=1736487 RepID=UPI00070D2880|nr:carboxyl transferase domain-containing protein [Noviherbaspirillum sp. Root189]KRB67940.1 methylmalonyl-CoA carboxyltransferase [Noviherbaspirillum sp. Root189]
MNWSSELAELQRRKEYAQAMGGSEKVARQHDNGKLTVRERVERLVDQNSFVEVGGLAGSGEYDANGVLKHVVPSNVVFGRAELDGKPVVVIGDDFTVRGGANDGAVGDKMIFAEQMAYDLRIPMVRLVDGTGGGGSVKNIEKMGYALLPKMKIWPYVARNLSQVPVVSLALGSVAGQGAARVAGSHYSMMVSETSQLFIAGPPVVAKIGQHLTKNELGGSRIHARNGVVDDEVNSEAEAFEAARRFLSYLPRSVHEVAKRSEAPVSIADQAWLRDAIPKDARKVYKIKPIVESLFDQGTVFEIGRNWGKAIMGGLARVNGWPVVFAASNPYFYGGGWDRQTAEKFVRLIDLAENFHLPVVNMVDIAGFQIGLEAEKDAVMRAGVRALTAVSQTTVPWFSLIMRKAFGVAGGGHQNSSRFNFRYAWPSAQWGSLPIEGGLEVAYRSEIESADDPEAKRAEIEARVRSLTSPYRSAEAFVIEDIIDPATTRERLEEFVRLAYPLLTPGETRVGYRP